MKYIRTKDGAIYKIENNKLIVGNIKVNCKDLQALEQEGYKIADTIEELCDEFVFVNKIDKFDKSYVIHYDMPNHIFTEPTIKEKIAYIKKYYYDNLNQIRGAIYTDKGLIYVAKMNDKGELKLI